MQVPYGHKQNPQAERLGIGGYCSFSTTTKGSQNNGLSDCGPRPSLQARSRWNMHVTYGPPYGPSFQAVKSMAYRTAGLAPLSRLDQDGTCMSRTVLCTLPLKVQRKAEENCPVVVQGRARLRRGHESPKIFSGVCQALCSKLVTASLGLKETALVTSWTLVWVRFSTTPLRTVEVQSPTGLRVHDCVVAAPPSFHEVRRSASS